MIRRSLLPLFLIVISVAVALGLPPALSSAATGDIQTQLDANSAQISALQAQIAEYQKQLNSLGTQKGTLKSAISSLTITQKQLAAQAQETQAKISSANLQIQKLTHSIGTKEENIAADQTAIAKALRTIAQGEEATLVTQIVSSHSIDEVWQVADEAYQFNEALIGHISDLRDARTQLTSNRTQVQSTKATLVSLQNDLASQKKSIDANKQKQQRLLAQTNNQESTYQKLLAAAKAELASYTAFTTNAGGSKLLANQTSCDDWGCYYSQRDTIWGNVPLSGTSERLAASGCLVTSMAMMMTHYGHRNVTPVTINADPGNFSAVGGLLLFTIRADGATATRVTSFIDATLASGNPVVVGIHAYGGTHFVVFTSGTKGNYLMRDPYIANAKDISFVANYPLSSIFSASKVVVKS